MTWMRGTLVLAISGLASVTVACSSHSTPKAPSSTSSAASSTVAASATTTASSIACPMNAPQFGDPDIQAALEAAPLPPGVSILQEIGEYTVDDKSMINILVYVCQPGLKGDPLKDVATVLAQSLKASPVSEKIQEMRVSNWADRDTDQTAKVRCENLQLHTFSAEANPGAVRASWKFPSQD